MYVEKSLTCPFQFKGGDSFTPGETNDLTITKLAAGGFWVVRASGQTGEFVGNQSGQALTCSSQVFATAGSTGEEAPPADIEPACDPKAQYDAALAERKACRARAPKGKKGKAARQECNAAFKANKHC